MLDAFTEIRGVADAGGIYRDEEGCTCWMSLLR